KIIFGGQAQIFDHLIIATPSYAAAKLLRPVNAQLADMLDEIQYESAVTVAVTYADGVYLPPGFGFLIPRDQDVPIIACTFVHNKFDHRVPKGNLLLRLFMKDAIDWPDEQIRTTVKQRLAAILRITAEPKEMHIFRWPLSMPQYDVGHLQRVSAIERLVT